MHHVHCKSVVCAIPWVQKNINSCKISTPICLLFVYPYSGFISPKCHPLNLTSIHFWVYPTGFWSSKDCVNYWHKFQWQRSVTKEIVLHHCTCLWTSAASFISTCVTVCLSLCHTGNTHLFSFSLCRQTTPLWRGNRSHRHAPQSSHMTILWRPVTSVSSPPTVSRVSRPHLVKIVSHCPGMIF